MYLNTESLCSFDLADWKESSTACLKRRAQRFVRAVRKPFALEKELAIPAPVPKRDPLHLLREDTVVFVCVPAQTLVVFTLGWSPHSLRKRKDAPALHLATRSVTTCYGPQKQMGKCGLSLGLPKGDRREALPGEARKEMHQMRKGA